MRRLLILCVGVAVGVIAPSCASFAASSRPARVTMRTLRAGELASAAHGQLPATGPTVSFTLRVPSGDHVNMKLDNEASVDSPSGRHFSYALVFAANSPLTTACRMEARSTSATACERVNARTLILKRGRELLVLRALNARQTVLLFTTNGIARDRDLALSVAGTIR